MKQRILLFEATLKDGQVVADENKGPIGKATFEDLPSEFKKKENEEFMVWMGRCATWVAESNAKVQALKRRLHKEGETFTINIKYLVE